MTLLLGAALGSTLAEHSKFDRKHYFYPDLPKGYQITQYDFPLCAGGRLQTPQGEVRLRRVHLEEDTARNLHRTSANGTRKSLIDFNRSGVPLLELVTEPDISSPEHAREFGKTLRSLVRYLGLSNADLERGEMRLEPSISLSKDGRLPPYKVEIKNINSFGFLEKAIRYEMERQSELLDEGVTPAQETRGWNETKGITMSQRTKENAEDYRYFPDPDIPPLSLREVCTRVAASLPELPAAKVIRWEKTYGIEQRFGIFFCEEQKAAEKWDALFGKLREADVPIHECVKDIANKKAAFTYETPVKEIEAFYRAKKADVPSAGEITGAVARVIAGQAKAASDYRAGNENALKFLMGQVFKELKTKSGAESIREELIKALRKG
jgi:aspartyl-tRNA(Asn)/glutamyl-tRNA(Gln) amidotransferase subunit B